jgi:hypothetical protein
MSTHRGGAETAGKLRTAAGITAVVLAAFVACTVRPHS